MSVLIYADAEVGVLIDNGVLVLNKYKTIMLNASWYYDHYDINNLQTLKLSTCSF